MRSMWRRRLVRSPGVRASEAPASFGFGWTSAAGRAVVVAISSPSSARRDLRHGPIRRQRAVRDRRVARVYVTDGTRGSGRWHALDEKPTGSARWAAATTFAGAA